MHVIASLGVKLFSKDWHLVVVENIVCSNEVHEPKSNGVWGLNPWSPLVERSRQRAIQRPKPSMAEVVENKIESQWHWRGWHPVILCFQCHWTHTCPPEGFINFTSRTKSYGHLGVVTGELWSLGVPSHNLAHGRWVFREFAKFFDWGRKSFLAASPMTELPPFKEGS